MLQPRRVKYRKPHKACIGRIAQRGYTLVSGTFGLKALEAGRITAKEIETVRVSLTRTMKREGSVYRRIFPHASYTSKPIEVRMGKGKGAPDYFAAIARPGTIIYEAGGISYALAKKAFRIASKKLSIKTKLVIRDDYQKA